MTPPASSRTTRAVAEHCSIDGLSGVQTSGRTAVSALQDARMASSSSASGTTSEASSRASPGCESRMPVYAAVSPGSWRRARLRLAFDESRSRKRSRSASSDALVVACCALFEAFWKRDVAVPEALAGPHSA